MKKNALFFLVLFCLFFTNITPAADNISPISEDRVTEIDKIIQDYYNRGKNLNNASVQREILDKININFPLDKNYTLNSVSDFEIAQMATKLTDEKYPKELKDLKQEYSKQADKKYNTASKNDNVTVKFRKGSNVYTATGEFKGYTMSGNGIIIGRNTIPTFDLLPISKYLFSESLCKKAKDRYVKNQIKQYLLKKNSFIAGQHPAAKESLIKANEDAGYIYYNDKWESPDNIAQSILNQSKEETLNHPTFANEKTLNPEFIHELLSNLNPYLFFSLFGIITLLNICGFICLIISFVRMFQNKKTAIGLICILLTIFSGFGPIISYIYSWVKSSEFGIKKLMKVWTYSILLNILVVIIFIWQFFSVILSLIPNQ